MERSVARRKNPNETKIGTCINREKEERLEKKK